MATKQSPTQPSPSPAPVPGKKQVSTKTLSVWSLVFSILSLLTIIIPLVGLLFAIISAIFTFKYVKRVGIDGFYTFTVVGLSGMAVFFGLVTLVAFIAFGGTLLNNLGL